MYKQGLLEEFTSAARATDLGVEISFSDDGRYVVFVDKTSTFGDILIEEDGEEIIVTFGRFTHSHFACYREDIDASQRRREIVSSVIDTLRQVFSGAIAFHGSHESGGRWGYCEPIDQRAASLGDNEIVSWPKKLIS
jgi:hypothetical protein